MIVPMLRSKVSFGPLNVAFAAGKFDGLLGLGFKSISQYQIPTPFESMIDQKLIDMPVFAFFLPTASGQDGELVAGTAEVPSSRAGRRAGRRRLRGPPGP